jgi:hypothetical protein
MKLVIVLSIISGALANSKPVVVRDNSTGQLYTSSLLTWEAFSNDVNQLKHAVSAGLFQGEDVSNYPPSCRVIRLLELHFITDVEGLRMSIDHKFYSRVGLRKEASRRG